MKIRDVRTIPVETPSTASSSGSVRGRQPVHGSRVEPGRPGGDGGRARGARLGALGADLALLVVGDPVERAPRDRKAFLLDEQVMPHVVSSSASSGKRIRSPHR